MTNLDPGARRRLRWGLGLLCVAAFLEFTAVAAGCRDIGSGAVVVYLVLVPALWLVALVLLVLDRERSTFRLVRLVALGLVPLGFLASLIHFAECASN